MSRLRRWLVVVLSLALAPGVHRVRLACATGERTRVVVLAR